VVVVDRSVEAQNGHVVIAVCNGDMTIKRLRRLRRLRDGRAALQAENPEFPEFVIGEDLPACRPRSGA